MKSFLSQIKTTSSPHPKDQNLTSDFIRFDLTRALCLRLSHGYIARHGRGSVASALPSG